MAIKTWIATSPSTWGTAASWSPSGVPTSADDIVFNGTYNGDCVFAFATIRSLVMTGYSGIFSGTANMTISNSDTGTATGNSLVFSSTMTQSWTGQTTFTSPVGGYITTNGKSFGALITFNNATGVWRVSDALQTTALTITTGNVTFTNNVTISGSLTLTAGTLTVLNCGNVTIGSQFVSSNTNVRTLNMGCGTWAFSAIGTPWSLSTSTNMTLNAEQSRILFTNVSASNCQFQGGGLTYYTFEIARGSGTGPTTIVGNNTFVNLIDVTSTAAHTISLSTSPTTCSVYNFIVRGSPGNLITLGRGAAGTYIWQKLGRGVVSKCDYITVISSITASPVNTWYLGANSAVGTSVNFIATDAPSSQSLLGSGGVG